MLAKKSKNMNKAVAFIKELSADEKVRYEADMRKRAIRDYNSAMYCADWKGIEQGKGMDHKMVASISGLSEEKTENLCK